MATERTPLRDEFEPKYVTQTDFTTTVRRKTRQFQCCLGALLLAFIICVTVIVVSYLGNRPNSDENGIEISNEELQQAIRSGANALKQRDSIELRTVLLQSSSPSFRHQKSMSTSKTADLLARSGYATYHASKKIANNREYNVTKPMESKCNISLIKAEGWCKTTRNETCSKIRHRSIDGTCNNLNHPFEWGVAFTKFRRMLAPSYADGVGEPRSSIYGGALPAASRVSAIVHRPTYKNDPNFTVMLAVWGQFLDHDITATALSRSKDGGAIACCVTQAQTSAHPECFPVFEEQKDGNIRCIDFVRSAPSATCCIGPREQMSQVSAYIDGSVVYGSNPELANKLRTFKDGKLKTLTTADGRELLPISEDMNDGCNREIMSSKGQYCFLAGDDRANENLHLTTMHLLWVRQHNLIADKLKTVNPNYDDEKLYEETRHIVAAQIQHITYNEFLPMVIGTMTANKLDLLPLTDGYYDGYNVEIDASIANGFAAAAFRFAHTLIPALVKIIANDTSSPEYVQLHKILFDPFRLYGGGELDRILHGAMQTPIEASDPYFNEEIKAHLFERADETPKSKCGLDLVALNIQRGRDHGLPGYVSWRRMCGLSHPTTFADMASYIDHDSLERITQLYDNVDDVDLYTGALSERPLAGSLLGPTINCLIVDQFMRLKRGDRFWYETGQKPQAFTPKQLNEIRKITLAGVICDTSDNIGLMPKWVMRRGDENVLCSDIEIIDYIHWRI